jgi:hypothetical protein
MEPETKEETDTTDYVATITPELLNLSNKGEYDFKPEVEVKCKVRSCSFMNYFLVFILFFLLFQIVLKLKIIHHKICGMLNMFSILSFKIDQLIKNLKPTEATTQTPVDCSPNLNYILDFIQHIDKKHKCD